MSPDTRQALRLGDPKPSARSRGRHPWVWRLGFFLMAAIGMYMAISFWSLNARLQDMRAEAAELQQVLYEKQGRNQALQQEIQALQTDEYIEKVAREQLGLTKPGEIRYLTGKSGKVPDASQR